MALNQTHYQWNINDLSNQTPSTSQTPKMNCQFNTKPQPSTQQANQTPVKHPTEVYHHHKWEDSISTRLDTRLENHLNRPRLPTGTTLCPLCLPRPDRAAIVS